MTTTQLTEREIDALAQMLNLALQQLRMVAETTVAEDDDDENGFSPRWELARRYYAARAAVAKLLGKQSWDVLSIGDDCRWAAARRAEAEAEKQASA
jgi:hypothetical protein